MVDIPRRRDDPVGINLSRLRRATARAVLRRLRPAWVRTLLDAELEGVETFAPPRLAVLGACGYLAVVAPHPDDESIGCGGLVRLWRRAGGRVRIHLLTRGERGDRTLRAMSRPPEAAVTALVATRTAEAERALAVLQAEADWLDGHDGALHGDLATVGERLAARWRDDPPDAIAAPFPFDRHSDHAAAARITAAAGEVLPPATPVWAYEVWSPAPVNVLLDITPVAEEKRRAIAAYASQLATTDYLAGAEALNRYRAVAGGLGGGSAEGFFRAPLARYRALAARLAL